MLQSRRAASDAGVPGQGAGNDATRGCSWRDAALGVPPLLRPTLLRVLPRGVRQRHRRDAASSPAVQTICEGRRHTVR